MSSIFARAFIRTLNQQPNAERQSPAESSTASAVRAVLNADDPDWVVRAIGLGGASTFHTGVDTDV